MRMAKGDINSLNAKRTQKERSEAASKAGKASGKKRREYASYRACMSDITDDDIRKEICEVLISRSKRGNLKAIELMLKIIGENPNIIEPVKEQMESDGFVEMMQKAQCKVVDDGDVIPDE